MPAVNEWNDPYPILEEDRTPSQEEEFRQDLLQRIATAYEEQHTTTPLDTGSSFKFQSLVEHPDSEGEAYEFRVKRFWKRRPAGSHTGTLEREGGEWRVSFDEPDGFLHRVFQISIFSG